MNRRSLVPPVALFTLFALVGCSVGQPVTPSPRPTASSTPGPSPEAAMLGPSGTPTVLASGLKSPWSVVPLGAGDSALISERDSGTVVEREASGTLRDVGVVAGVQHQGEGGLLGLAIHGSGSERWLYAYLTTATDNRIVRMRLLGASGGYRLGAQTPILIGLAKAGNHDGGRIAFGPDGALYATVGDAGDPSRAQDPGSLNGKILRMTATGTVPADNPTAGSLVYSMGHRNPQGLAWDESGQLYAAEFGQNTWDEFNRIDAGGNYGWPVVEGIGSKAGYLDPLYQWPTADASPSGLANVGGTFFLAALRGQRLWSILPGNTTTATPSFTGEYGRLRDAVAGPDGTLWLLTNNTDGRGTPSEGDDKLLQVPLDDLGAG